MTALTLRESELQDVKNWSHLIFGTYSIKEVLQAVSDPVWQSIRISMLGEPLRRKMQILEDWLDIPDELTEVGSPYTKKVQVTNYVHALKRGGLIR